MEEARYNQLVGTAFKAILRAVDDVDPDELDADSTGDMVTLSARSGEKCVVNTQRAVHQIWVAGKSQGVHFSFDERTGKWLDDKGKGLELFSFVRDVVQQIAGVSLALG